ncbi:hypothetical protein GALL_551590 [mine drainage metagenome]|uniref:Uncharacterized protein n=1 Tax=mine drainage metagenome TaxID=410659 RepID=A0A1J5P774_9ZZZZ
MRITHRHVINVTRRNDLFGLEPVFVDTDNHVLAAVNAGLLLRCCGFNLELGPAAVNGFGHATHGLHLFDDGPGGIRHVLRQLFHHIAASPGVDHVGDVGFFLDDELRVAGDAGAEFGG